MFTRKDFCIIKKVYNGAEFLYISDKPSMSTALCVQPNGNIFRTLLLDNVHLTLDELDEILDRRDEIKLNIPYDFETFLNPVRKQN